MSRTGSKAHVMFSRALRTAVIAALVAVMAPVGVPSAYADIDPVTYWVDVANGNDVTNPGSEAAPWKTISKALSVASGIDTIMVRPGTYSEANGETPYNETTLFLLEGESLVSAEGQDATKILGDNTRQLLQINGWADGDRLEGFTIENGGTSGSAAVGVWLAAGASHPTISECAFQYNRGGTGGGALSIGGAADSTILVNGNQFDHNTASDGGAIRANSFGLVIISDNTFVANEAGQGGALSLYSHEDYYAVDSNQFWQNVTTASGSGGAIYWWGHDLDFSHHLSENLFQECRAEAAGGAVYLAHVNVIAERNQGYANSAPLGGFGFAESATVYAENNFFTENAATIHGSVWNLDSTSRLEQHNDTLWAQAAGPQATHLSEGGDGWLYIVNCIYWNPALQAEMERATVSYTCSYRGSGELASCLNTVGAGMVYADPMIDTGAPPWLVDGSPCIDAGNPFDYPPADIFFEGRPQGPAPDIGCFEFPRPVLMPVYRFYRPSTGTHFYTADESEMLDVRNRLGGIFEFEGVAYTLNPRRNATWLYRLYRPSTGTHFYTADYHEMMNARHASGGIYTYEGIAYNVSSDDEGGTYRAVYRFFKPSNGTHFYTADAAERDNVITNLPHIYQYEGTAFWVGE